MDALSDTRPRVVAIGGPTATGKTALSVHLAKQFGGEIISADSMQIYRGLDVGTAKVVPEEQGGIPHHLLDILPPEKTFSVADYTARADQAIREITGRGALPLVVGGTGLYITSLLNGVQFTPQKTDPALRKELESRAEAGQKEQLYRELQTIDPAYAAQVHPNNLPRVIRALELFGCTGKTMTGQRAESLPPRPPYRALCLCLTCRDREELYRRIDTRVDRMVEQGILREAESVWHHREEWPTAAQAIGYKEFFSFFDGTATLEACIETLKQASRNYAKRQLTWFRRQNEATWLYAEDADVYEQAATIVQTFLTD